MNGWGTLTSQASRQEFGLIHIRERVCKAGIFRLRSIFSLLLEVAMSFRNDRASLQIIVLEFSELFHGAEEIGDLGQDGVFQNGLIGDEGVGGSDPFYRRVKVMK